MTTRRVDPGDIRGVSTDQQSEVREMWEGVLGRLLDAEEASALVGTPETLRELEGAGDLIVLTMRSGERCYPSRQFIDGAPLPVLAAAHRLLSQFETEGWSAASWTLGGQPHPELDGQSVLEWAAAGNDPNQLLLVAKRDASALAH